MLSAGGVLSSVLCLPCRGCLFSFFFSHSFCVCWPRQAMCLPWPPTTSRVSCSLPHVRIMPESLRPEVFQVGIKALSFSQKVHARALAMTLTSCMAKLYSFCGHRDCRRRKQGWDGEGVRRLSWDSWYGHVCELSLLQLRVAVRDIRQPPSWSRSCSVLGADGLRGLRRKMARVVMAGQPWRLFYFEGALETTAEREAGSSACAHVLVSSEFNAWTSIEGSSNQWFHGNQPDRDVASSSDGQPGELTSRGGMVVKRHPDRCAVRSAAVCSNDRTSAASALVLEVCNTPSTCRRPSIPAMEESQQPVPDSAHGTTVLRRTGAGPSLTTPSSAPNDYC